MSNILINKNKQIYVNAKDILDFIWNKNNEIKVTLYNFDVIVSDRDWSELINEFNIKRKGGNKNNMAKKPVKKGTKKGQ